MSSDHHVTKAKLRHIPQLRRLFHQGLYGDFRYFPADYLSATDQANNLWRLGLASLRPSRVMFVALSNDELVGYTITGLQATDKAFIFWVYVSQSYRDQGLGRLLMESTLADLQNRAINQVQLATYNFADFYKQYGFQIDESQTFVIGDTNMYIMNKELSDS